MNKELINSMDGQKIEKKMIKIMEKVSLRKNSKKVVIQLKNSKVKVVMVQKKTTKFNKI